jgi:hypothetical protein
MSRDGSAPVSVACEDADAIAQPARDRAAPVTAAKTPWSRKKPDGSACSLQLATTTTAPRSARATANCTDAGFSLVMLCGGGSTTSGAPDTPLGAYTSRRGSLHSAIRGDESANGTSEVTTISGVSGGDESRDSSAAGLEHPATDATTMDTTSDTRMNRRSTASIAPLPTPAELLQERVRKIE